MKSFKDAVTALQTARSSEEFESACAAAYAMPSTGPEIYGDIRSDREVGGLLYPTIEGADAQRKRVAEVLAMNPNKPAHEVHWALDHIERASREGWIFSAEGGGSTHAM